LVNGNGKNSSEILPEGGGFEIQNRPERTDNAPETVLIFLDEQEKRS